jgi:DNA-binding transcriptional ArsR family regulator
MGVIKTALKHLFGETPVVKVLDFLIDHKGYEYSKMEIADNSDIEWASFNGHWILLEELELVKGSRKIGNETRYTLNEENTIVRKLLEFDHEAAMYMSERLAEKEMVEDKVHTVELEAIKIQG